MPNSIPLTVFLALLTLAEWNLIFDTAQKFLASLALIAAGIWAYYKVFKGRTYHPRLEPKISGSVTCSNDVSYVLATAQLTNLGLSNVSILPTETILTAFTYSTTKPAIATAVPDRSVADYAIFADHAWIEPDETIEDQLLLAIPGCNHLAFRLELRVASQARHRWFYSQADTRKAVSVVYPVLQPQPQAPESDTSDQDDTIDTNTSNIAGAKQRRNIMPQYEDKMQHEQEEHKAERLRQAEAERRKRAIEEQARRDQQERERQERDQQEGEREK